jgi:RNase P subunit RPR2
MDMNIEITCRNCKKIIAINSVIEDAMKGEGSDRQSVVCENCGEKISYWQITAQLRDQKKLGWRLRQWFQNLFKSRA